MPLTDKAIRNAKPGGKPIKLFDERGPRMVAPYVVQTEFAQGLDGSLVLQTEEA
jgi:hypothetical protein